MCAGTSGRLPMSGSPAPAHSAVSAPVLDDDVFLYLSLPFPSRACAWGWHPGLHLMRLGWLYNRGHALVFKITSQAGEGHGPERPEALKGAAFSTRRAMRLLAPGGRKAAVTGRNVSCHCQGHGRTEDNNR